MLVFAFWVDEACSVEVGLSVFVNVKALLIWFPPMLLEFLQRMVDRQLYIIKG